MNKFYRDLGTLRELLGFINKFYSGFIRNLSVFTYRKGCIRQVPASAPSGITNCDERVQSTHAYKVDFRV